LKKLILNQVKRASHFVKIIVAGPHRRLPKLPESNQRKQAIANKGSLFYSHCAPNRTTLWSSLYRHLGEYNTNLEQSEHCLTAFFDQMRLKREDNWYFQVTTLLT
jgi:hypothetical protein